MKRFVLFIFICGYSFASNYYVSNQGSDENPGTINSPFKTIQKAADVEEVRAIQKITKLKNILK